jgi:hypothetical protein
MWQKMNFVLLVVVAVAVVVAIIQAGGAQRRTTLEMEQLRQQVRELHAAQQEATDEARLQAESAAQLRLAADSKQSEELAAERARAEALSGFLRDLLLVAGVTDGMDSTSTRDVLREQAMAHADAIEASDPETAAAIRSAMANDAGEEGTVTDGGDPDGEGDSDEGGGDEGPVSPYPALEWVEGLPQVRWDGPWYQVQRINNIPIEDVIAFCNEHYGEESQRRFALELVDVLAEMGQPVEGTTVSLRLRERETGSIMALPQVQMTGENYRLLAKHLGVELEGGE